MQTLALRLKMHLESMVEEEAIEEEGSKKILIFYFTLKIQ